MWRKDVKAASILSPTTQDDHYWYDGLRQVTRHDRGSLTPAGGPPYTGVGNLQQQEDWTYDETGNWKQYQSFAPSLVQTREHNVANQITDIVDPSGVVQPVFDPAGNMRTMPAPGNWTKAYTCKWDAWNRLVEIRDGSTLVQANSYDARTRRIRKQNATETRDYYYDRQWRALEERVSGAIQADYVYSPTDRWNLIRRRRSVSGTLNETRFVLRDYLDPVAIITAAGVVDERYGYEAFGPVRVMDANFATRSSSTCAWNWLYHGEFLDGESGMYDYGYRFYHPALGRWPSRDPIGENGGVNLYGYTGNRPISHIDILGLKTQDEAGMEGANEATELTKKSSDKPNQRIEYCGLICCKKGDYFKTGPIPGDVGTCTPDKAPCPEGSKRVGVYHSHPSNSDFSLTDYETLWPGESNYLGRPDGVRKLTKEQEKGTGKTKPKTEKLDDDGTSTPYPPENNDLRARQGLPPLNNGTGRGY